MGLPLLLVVRSRTGDKRLIQSTDRWVLHLGGAGGRAIAAGTLDDLATLAALAPQLVQLARAGDAAERRMAADAEPEVDCILPARAPAPDTERIAARNGHSLSPTGRRLVGADRRRLRRRAS